jgi:hypothetical protein
MRARRTAALLAALAPLLLTAVVTTAPAHAENMPDACLGTADTIAAVGTVGADVAAGTVSILGQTTPVDLTTLDLAVPRFPDPSRALWWRSLEWLAAVYLAGTPTLPLAGSADPVADVASAMLRHPDPGSATPAALAKANATGWDEGTNYSRESALNCLYALTSDDRLLPALAATVAANKDPVRYYGPPGKQVHNHGLLANLALVQTADLTDDPDLRAFAIARLTLSAPKAFSPFGFTYEQSTDYHDVNVREWTNAAAIMAADQAVPAATNEVIAAELQAARRIGQALVDPAGHTAAIGDSHPALVTRPVAQRTLVARDDPGGVAVGRWSWTDPSTSWWAVRYGPAQTMHGHQDHGSILWSTLGVPVLVDPGYSTFDPADPLTAWQKSPAAHNVAVPVADPHIRTTSRMLLLQRTGRADTFVVQNRSWQRAVLTTAVVDDARHRLSMTQRVNAGFATHLHLAPGWTFRRHAGLVWTFVSRTRVLTITTTSPPSSAVLLRGSTVPIGGWVFPAFGVKQPANELVLGGVSTQSLVLTVSRR